MDSWLLQEYFPGSTGQPTLSDLEISSVSTHRTSSGSWIFRQYRPFNAFVSLDNGMNAIRTILRWMTCHAFGTIVPRKKLSALSEFARKCIVRVIYSSNSPSHRHQTSQLRQIVIRRYDVGRFGTKPVNRFWSMGGSIR